MDRIKENINSSSPWIWVNRINESEGGGRGVDMGEQD